MFEVTLYVICLGMCARMYLSASTGILVDLSLHVLIRRS